MLVPNFCKLPDQAKAVLGKEPCRNTLKIVKVDAAAGSDHGMIQTINYSFTSQ